MKHLVIGTGQIGQALARIFDCDSHDIEPLPEQEYDMIHISFPYSDKFLSQVKEYQERYKPTHTVIHSTVPIGTSDSLGACHSPVTGKHPDLEESILTFTKPVAGKNARAVSVEFWQFGIPAKNVSDKASNTEAGKLWALNIYGINVLLEKAVYEYCERNDLDWHVVYKEFVQSYNDGYNKLGLSQFQMYDLEHHEGDIGGHCVIQNAPHLDDFWSIVLQDKNSNL